MPAAGFDEVLKGIALGLVLANVILGLVLLVLAVVYFMGRR